MMASWSRMNSRTHLHKVPLTAPHGHPDKSRCSIVRVTPRSLVRATPGAESQDAILMIRVVVDLPSWPPFKPRYLGNFDNSFAVLNASGLTDLDHAISRNAVDLNLLGHPHKPGCLINLSSSFQARFKPRRLADLVDEVSMLRSTAELPRCPNHLHKPGYLRSRGRNYDTLASPLVVIMTRLTTLASWTTASLFLSSQGDEC
ncbi:hypothetical protein L210DRAFT_2339601 [Boletus edulis BED1]|uniref:Uncharacterized protein n=1 Tax=Boletus edulis BED1 TaxID=1328754 RepID=A0AAD4BR42_BOLED|nr:hypothetical protein L210DRAFT_2339601 [Boletus edulis BED1]